MSGTPTHVRVYGGRVVHAVSPQAFSSYGQGLRWETLCGQSWVYLTGRMPSEPQDGPATCKACARLEAQS